MFCHHDVNATRLIVARLYRVADGGLRAARHEGGAAMEQRQRRAGLGPEGLRQERERDGQQALPSQRLQLNYFPANGTS